MSTWPRTGAQGIPLSDPHPAAAKASVTTADQRTTKKSVIVVVLFRLRLGAGPCDQVGQHLEAGRLAVEPDRAVGKQKIRPARMEAIEAMPPFVRVVDRHVAGN